MGEKQSRPANLAGEQHSGRQFRRQQIRPSLGRRGMRALVLGTAAMLGLPLIAAGLAWAQDTPAKSDAAAKSEAPRQSAPESPAQDAGPAEALSLRYRFIERYSAKEDPNHPELLTQYEVGLLETQKTEREKQQGAPDRFQFSHQTIYTERTAEASKTGELASAVRRYDTFRIKGEIGPNQRPKVPFFEGLTILYKLQPRDRSLILNLTDDRPLREFEYSRLTTQVFMPRLTALLPQTPRLVADTWAVPARAVQGLVGELPGPEDYDMTGTLVEVRKAGEGPALTAIIGISGQMNLPSFGASSLNAQIHFVFHPVAAVPPAAGSGTARRPGDTPASKGGRRPEEGIVNARGYISRVLMAWKATNLLPDEEARLKQTRTYELQLARRLAAANNAVGGPKELLQVPVPIPTATEANSWLLYEDPMARFHLLHPQNLALNAAMSDVNSIHLVDQDPGHGTDAFVLTLSPGPQDPQTDREFRDVGAFQRAIADHWAKLKYDTLPGPTGWLPPADWTPLKVYRKELAVKTNKAEEGGGGAQRIYIDDYLVQSTNNQCFHVESWTVRDNHVAFRTQSEGIIKSFRFGKWDPHPKAPATAPAAPPVTPAN